REAAARAYASAAAPKPEVATQLVQTARRALDLFSGAEKVAGEDGPPGGLAALSAFLERDVPQAERERISEVLLRILNGSLLELDQLARAKAGVALPPADEARQRFMTQAVVSLSDAAFFPAPLLVTLQGFEQRQASVFQVARAPGQKLVYLGAVLLIVGVFAMLYVRERRIWVWLTPQADGSSQALLALSSARSGPDLDAEFQQLRTLIQP
ncbi:MAG: cytochrome c biogenesis protein ResB, partial [Burkholderiales bacterium]|nr:cytochrome c biogenesis protein ResB [Burkholderiales bacterium]